MRFAADGVRRTAYGVRRTAYGVRRTADGQKIFIADSCSRTSETTYTYLKVCIPAQNRHGVRYEYMALEAEGGGAERLEMERKAKEEANTACSHYLKGCPRYTLLEHLKDI
ncbi:unnamed protein product, partial [Nesidiocoris tenuis]